MKRIVFIGGHHNSALVVAKILKKKGHHIFWFGHKHTMRGEESLSLEFQEVKKAKIPFKEIKTAKFYRTYNPFQLLKIGSGFLQSFYYLMKIRPQVIVSFGGYLSFPVVLAGFLLKIKIIIHEQTTRAGLANRLLAPLAQKILLTWPTSQRFFPEKKTSLIGLPLNPQLFDTKKPPSPFKEKLPIILVTGGKQGSHIINKSIEKNLELWLKKFNLIHQSGGIIKTNDFVRLSQKKDSLPEKLKKRYILKKFFYGKEMMAMIKSADLVISRSGAHIVYELAALAKPALFIPLPWAYNNEQMANAQILSKAGTALIIPQKKITPRKLYQEAGKMINDLEKFRSRGQVLSGVRKNAASQMAVIIERINEAF
jgi:UDP-N-acetylglucosamine--N-acetylmuramyl-(pentapeptide) pyrophosphoryl-undecaprenol N-acetylglucosamine transferase